MKDIASVTGASPNPTELAQRFSPTSNPRAGRPGGGPRAAGANSH